jgi:Fibronectin type III domain
MGLIGVMAVTLFGIGAANNAIANYDASSWLFSSNKGEVARVNGVTGRVDTRYKITDSQGHTIQVTQTDRYVILRDLTTGKVSVLDLSTLQIAATTQTTAGLGVTVALHGSAAFIIDSVQGVVSQLDPATLVPVGEPLRFPPGIDGGTFDEAGRLWLLVPSEGTVVAISPSLPPSVKPGGGTGGGALGDPKVVKTVTAGDPSHDLAISVLDTGVAVLDKTAATLTTLRGNDSRTVPLTLSGPGDMPARTIGADVPVTVVDDRHVYVVNDGKVIDFTVPGSSPRLKPCVAWSARFYCADDATGTVYVLDNAGKLTNTVAIPNAGGVLELEVRENHLFINAPNAAGARVVDSHHKVKVVDKYASNVLGAEAPPNPPPPPPTKPAVGPPGAPTKVTASAGNAQARITWGPAAPNGSAILKYVIEGDGKVYEVGANQRTYDVTGLTNGQQYRFTVYAVNAKGPGAKRAANPVVPTSDVPDPPLTVAATDKGDGTVTVTWGAANGQGHKVVRYDVTAISRGGQAPIGEATGTSLTIPAGKLTYGTQYAFTVVSVNDLGANSKPSPVSNTIVPFTVPDRPGNLVAAQVPNQRGAIQVRWQAPQDNGRPILRYVVKPSNGPSQDVTGTNATLGGFGDGALVTVTVSAVNAAGAGPTATASARTINQPTLTLGGSSSGYNSITVNFAANDGGGSPATCTLSVAGAGSASGNCASLSVGGLWPGNGYGYTVTVTNAANMSVSAGGSQGTTAMYGTVLCSVPSYCGRGAPGGGIWVYTTPNQNGRSVGDVFAPDRYLATCWTTGNSTINARPYGGKQDNRWIRIRFGGDNYIPFAWFQLDGGDNPGMLPHC